MSTEQEYFLTRLSLHGRAVTTANYPVLVREYKGTAGDAEVEDRIVHPLVDRGLVDRLAGSDGVVRLTAHPLMKLAFSTWLEPNERRRAHEQWARAAASAPRLFFTVRSAPDIDTLQPFIEATEQYLAAGNWREAWNIFREPLSLRLMELGYYSLALKIAKQFDECRLGSDDWNGENTVLLFDRLAALHHKLDLIDEALLFRRKELAAARDSGSHVPEVENIVAIVLARAGFVREAAAINPADFPARGAIGLAKGRYTQAAKSLRAAMKSAAGHDRTVGAQPLAEALYRAGNFDEATRVLEEGLSLATAKQFTCCERAILLKLSHVALLSGDLPKARDWFQIYNQLLQRLEAPTQKSYWLLLAEGDFDGALATAEESPSNTPRYLIDRHVRRARVFLRQGRSREGVTELDAAEREVLKSGFKQFKNEIAALRHELRLEH